MLLLLVTWIPVVKEIPVRIYDMARTQNNDILLSMGDSSGVTLLTQSGEIKPFITVAPLITNGLYSVLICGCP
jgi:hypothetical protein